MPSPHSAAPAGRPNPRPNRRRGIPALVALLAVAALSAGILSRMIPGLPTRQTGGEGAPLLEEVIVNEYAIQAEAKALEHVVLQLELPRDCPWPDCMVPWGHVPAFTLFDDGHVIYTGAEDFPPYLVHRGMALPEEWAPLLQHVSDLVAASLSPLSATTPCPASGGCRGANVIVRIRREGRLETYVALEGGDAATVDTVERIVERIQGWPPPIDHQVFTPNMETVWDVTEWAMEASPPPLTGTDGTYFGETELPSDRFPVMVEWDRGTRLHDVDSFGRAVDDGTDASAFAPEVGESAWDSGWPEAYWYRPEGHWLMRPVFVADGVRVDKAPLKLAVVPWIYPGDDLDAGTVDVEAQMDVDVYAEALANAAAARANAYATADAALVAIADETDFRETHDIAITAVSVSRYVRPTPFPTAALVHWSNDGRPTLPAARGIQTWMHWFRYDEDRAALTRLREAGFEWFKQRFAWADMQPTGSQGMDTAHSDLYIQTVNDLGGRVMIQLAVPPAWAVDAGSDDPFNLVVWERFVSAFALRYSGKVDAYEIMNEPNLAREWDGAPDTDAYARVLKVAYDAIKSADSNAVVISAGLAPTGDRMPEAMGDDTFLRELIEDMDGSTEGYLDAIGVHAAGFKAAPDVSPDEAAASPELGGDRTFTFRRIEDLRALMMERSRAYAPLVITEFGWTVDPRPASPYHWAAIDPIERGTFIATVFEQNTALFENDMWLGGPVILFSAADRAWTAADEAYWWAVADAEGKVDGVVLEALGLDVPSEGEND